MKNEMDGLLKCVLAPSVEPKAELNQKILGIIKENEYMKKEKYEYSINLYHFHHHELQHAYSSLCKGCFSPYHQ